MKLEYCIKTLCMRETFSIAYGNYNQRKALVVCLSHAGKYGFGECVEINYYGINLQQFEVDLKAILPTIEKHQPESPSEFYHLLEALAIHPFLRSALDCAFWDLYGKMMNKSFAEINNLENTISVKSSITISIAPIANQIQKIRESKWEHFKVKCNGLSLENVEKLLQLDQKIALDANASFTEKDCITLQENPDSTKFSYIEQPLPIDHYSQLNRNQFAVWMADEDAQNAAVLQDLQPHYKAINIKLMKCGGLSPALEIITKAKAHGFQVMLGCMTESSIGISAACALASLLDFADLDGANLISNDYASGSYVENGNILLSEKPGLGISLL